jgi:superfamily I DNA/RNA helicase
MQCRDAHAEAHAVVGWVRDLIQGRDLKPHEVCVTLYKPLVIQRFNTAGIQTHELKDREDPGEKVPGVRLGSMKRIKGLEFRAVAMACTDQHDPHENRPDIEALSRCERYVAATRAREYLLVTLPEA